MQLKIFVTTTNVGKNIKKTSMECRYKTRRNYKMEQYFDINR